LCVIIPPVLPKVLCFVDIETTGGSLSFDRVIEIGILRVEDGKLVKTYKTLIHPGRHVPQEIFELTHIPQGELSIAPGFREVAEDIVEILDGAVFVAHNVRFDYCFLKAELRRRGINFSPKQICTVKLSRKLYPQFRHHNLDSIIERHNFKIKNRHRAFDDAAVLWEFYQKVQTEFPGEKIAEAINLCLRRPTIPVQVPQHILDNLPDTPGVYIFYGEKGMPLYVGKSVNIRTRVLSHFSSDHLSGTELKIAQQVERIEAIETAGELGALIKESSLVKELQPLYNRKLRHANNLIVAKWIKGEKDYDRIDFVYAHEILPDELGLVLATFKSLKQAKAYLMMLSKAHQLCEKLLGVEKTSSECFAYRLGRCKGACKGKESPASYNMRFATAFSDTKIRAWPFENPVLISEKGEGESEEAFLIDKWIYLGSIKSDSELKLERDVRFDLDVYKILRSYLRNPKNSKKIKLLKLNDQNSLLMSQV
jgi:DNA polymerase III subunit epsilon